MRHTPMQLRVLLHHFYSPANWSTEQRDCPAAGEATTYWLENGCLEERDDTENESGFVVTDKGRAQVEAWLNAEPVQPLPEPMLTYVQQGGVKCPCCGSEDLTGHSVEVDAGTAWQRIDCDECGASWCDNYALVDYSGLEPGDEVES